MFHFYVGWAGNVRYAKATDHKAACKSCYGIVTNEMVSVQLPKNPKYMSNKDKQKYLDKFVQN